MNQKRPNLAHTKDSEKNSKPSVFIAIPNMGEIETELHSNTMYWQMNPNYRTIVWTPSYLRPIPVARNVIVREFLNGDFEWLLMIDDDVVPSRNILDLIGFRKDIISPLIFTVKNLEIIPIALQLKDSELRIMREFDMNSVIEVGAVGSGCILIHRRVFSHLSPPYFQYQISEDGCQLIEGEDFDFCKRAAQKKLKIFIHTGYIAKHIHKIDISGVALKWRQLI